MEQKRRIYDEPVSSGSTLFATLIWFWIETPYWNNGTDQIQRWESPFQKLMDEKIQFVNESCINYEKK